MTFEQRVYQVVLEVLQAHKDDIISYYITDGPPSVQIKEENCCTSVNQLLRLSYLRGWLQPV
jgi:hypothetical protein